MGFEAYVAGQYRVGEVSLRQAAGLLGVTLWEALDRLAALGATGNASGESVLAALATLEASTEGRGDLDRTPRTDILCGSWEA